MMIDRFLIPALAGLSMLSPAVAPSDSVLYVLQHDNVTPAQLRDAAFTWLIVEPTIDTGTGQELTPAEVADIETGGPCAKTTLAYLSIGEAEDYRSYWDASWVDGAGNPIPGVAPAWLGPQNPDFPGNYKVRFWDPDWQALILGTPAGTGETPLDRIIDQGMDGVYLDIIDGYYFWSTSADGGIPELSRMQARTLMIDFIETIANYAHTTRNTPGFLVFPQNASDIIRNDAFEFDADTDRYFAAIDGIGQEDLFYNELTAQPPAETQFVLDHLREFPLRGKTVLVTDYVIKETNQSAPKNDARVADFYARCAAEGFIPYAAISNRALDVIVTFAGPGWSQQQPAPGCGAPPADINGDGIVDTADLGILLGAFGTNDPAPDLNGDGVVDTADLGELISAFGISRGDFRNEKRYKRALNRLYKAALRDGLERTRRQRKLDRKRLKSLSKGQSGADTGGSQGPPSGGGNGDGDRRRPPRR